MSNNLLRLHKVIASAGLCSRRKSESLIITGQVEVNNEVVTTLGFKVTSNDIIKVKGQVIQRENHLYFAFYKPHYCLTTVSDPKKRPTVMIYFTNINERIYPVGRLDYDTTGLLLMTNDGNFANAIIHPRYKVDKIYEVLIKGFLPPVSIERLQTGLTLNGGFRCAPAIVKIINVNSSKKTTLLHLTIHEGQNQQVKRMIKAVNSKVLLLKRIQIGNITLQGLKMGQYRTLTKQEISTLLALSGA